MIEVNIHEAKTHLSRLLTHVVAGEEVLIAKAGKPVARLVPWRQLSQDRVPGLDRGTVQVPADFDTALPASILATFES